MATPIQPPTWTFWPSKAFLISPTDCSWTAKPHIQIPYSICINIKVLFQNYRNLIQKITFACPQLRAGCLLTLLCLAGAVGDIPEQVVRSRRLPKASTAQLAVSGPRGVGCVVFENQRAFVLDLEEDEGNEGGDGTSEGDDQY